MIKKISFSLLAFLLCCAVSASAQTAYSPAKNAPERRAILDALRVAVEKQLKQKIVFKVEHFKIQGSWAFVGGAPQNASGGRPDYRDTPYGEAIDAGAFDNNFFALLRKTGTKWRVVNVAIGCTDVCYATWHDDYRAPKAIFPYTE